MRNFTILSSIVFSFFLFSPQITFANESDGSKVDEGQAVETSTEIVDEKEEQTKEIQGEKETTETNSTETEEVEIGETVEQNEQNDNNAIDNEEQTEEVTEDPNTVESGSKSDNETESAVETVTDEEKQEEQIEQETSVKPESEENKEDKKEQEENNSAKKVTTQSVDDFSDGVLENGESHEDLITFKEQLNTIGFGGILETKNFGDYTEKKVREFQDNYGLNVNGKLDPATIAKLDEVYNSPFQADNRHPGISDLKVKLNRMGFSGIIVSDKYGDYTAKKVKEFQRYVNLEPNGIADATTREKLYNLYNYGFHETSDRFREIADFKEKLNQIGFGGIIVSDNYGSYTAKKVKEFQSYYGLEATGRTNGATLDKIDDIYYNSIRQGMRHSDVEQLKIDLNDLGFGGSIISTLLGSYTEKQVKRFQDYYGLKETGIVEEKTLNKINEVKSSPFQEGIRHDDTRDLKKNLNRLGFGTMIISDLYGSYTKKQVRKFQEHYGLRVNGIADEVTLQKIDSLMSNGFKEGARHTGIVDLKRDLNRIGFGKITVTSLYGSFTAKKVKEFQEYYGLTASGKADDATFDKIEEILDSPYQLGNRDSRIKELKNKLNALGYGHIQETTLYGSYSEKKVKEFQKDHKLVISGIVDDVTLDKINSEYDAKRKDTETQYSSTLEEALDKQMNVSGTKPQTDAYRNDPAYVHGDYLDFTDTVITDPDTYVNIRTEPKLGDDYKKYTLKPGTEVIFEKEVTGDKHDGSTKWYQIKYDDETLFAHSSLIVKDSVAKTTSNLKVREETNRDSHVYGVISEGEEVNVIEKVGNWYQISYQAWRNAKRSDVEEYLKPNNNNEYQHLLLSGTARLSADDLREKLSGKGTLNNTEHLFLEASEKYNVNEAYLVAHALHETGGGDSTLAEGVEVGKNKDGDAVVVTSSNRSKLTDIETVYNFFGIGAIDSNPVPGGSKKAYEEEWFSVKDAILGGAEWISTNYIERGQDTLYKMKWNPAKPATHQYATDIAWATKQLRILTEFYDDYPDAFLHFDFPVYK